MDENVRCFRNRSKEYPRLRGRPIHLPPTCERPSFDVEVKNANCDQNRRNKYDRLYPVPEKRPSSQEGNYIFDTLRFLLDRLVVRRPVDPIRYLSRLLDDCILFRSGLKKPRLFWTEKYLPACSRPRVDTFYGSPFLFYFRHLDALFRNLHGSDSTDLLPLDRYESAMEILGVRSYDPCPAQRVPGYVDRLTFRVTV